MTDSNTDLSGLTEQNLLQYLVDVRTPDAVSWWPLAPGWWLVLVVVLVMVVWRVKNKSRRSKSHGLITDADKIHGQFKADENAALYWHRMSKLMRSTVLTRADRNTVANLQGRQWVRWLEKAVDSEFSENTIDLLCNAHYQKSPPIPDQAVHSELVDWLKHYAEQEHQPPVNHHA